MLDIHLDDEKLRMSALDPDHVILDGKMMLGAIPAREKQRITVLIDPREPYSGPIKGNIIYRDQWGNTHVKNIDHNRAR